MHSAARHATAPGRPTSEPKQSANGTNDSFAASLDSLLADEVAIEKFCVQLTRGEPITRGTEGPRSNTNRGRPTPPLTHESVRQSVLHIQSQLQSVERRLQELRTAAFDEPELNQEDQQRKLQTIEKHAGIIEDLHGTLRTSILRARAEVERASALAREELLGKNDESTMKRRQRQSVQLKRREKLDAIVGDEQCRSDRTSLLASCFVVRLSVASSLAQSAAFTRSLHRTRSLLSDEIGRSSNALATLTSSTRVLGETSAEYHTYEKTVKVGSKIITKQLQRERTDKILIAVGLCFFALVVCYIINKRLTPFLLWWTHFFVSKTPITITDSTNSPIGAVTTSTNLVYETPKTTLAASSLTTSQPVPHVAPDPITPVYVYTNQYPPISHSHQSQSHPPPPPPVVGFQSEPELPVHSVAGSMPSSEQFGHIHGGAATIHTDHHEHENRHAHGHGHGHAGSDGDGDGHQLPDSIQSSVHR